MSSMKEILEKGLYTGLGLISMSAEAIDKAVKKISEDFKLSQEEGKKLYEDLSEKAEQAKQDIQGKIDESVDKTLKKMKLAKISEVDELKKRVEELEEELKKKEG